MSGFIASVLHLKLPHSNLLRECYVGDMSDQYVKMRKQPRQDLAESVPLSAPFTLFVEPTNKCNFSCSFCPESLDNFFEVSGGRHTLSLVDFERVVSQLMDFNVRLKTLNFYMMGEPLINRALPDMIRVARASDVADRIIVTSNGSLLRGSVVKRLIRDPPDFLRISVYGATERAHSETTKASIGLEVIKDNLAAFMTERGAGHLPYIYVKMIDQGPDANSQFLEGFSHLSDEIEIEPVMDWDSSVNVNFSGLSSESLLQTEYFSNRKEVCPSPFYTLVVHADLSVSVCCVDWSKKTTVGSLRDQTLQQIWLGDELRQFQRMHLSRRAGENEACKNCKFIHTFPDNLDALSLREYDVRVSRARSATHS